LLFALQGSAPDSLQRKPPLHVPFPAFKALSEMQSVAVQRLFVFAILFLVALRLVNDYDVFFHMVVGREVLRRMAVPTEEFYILLLQGQPGEYFEWGFGVIYHLVQSLAGTVGMSIFNALLAAGAITLVVAAGLRRETAWWIALVPAALLLWWMDFRLVFRPETLLFLFIAAEIYLLERYLASADHRYLAPLPPIAWILAQCHPSPAILVMVLGAYGLQVLLQAPPSMRLRRGLAVAGTGAAMLVLAAINPHGIQQIILPFTFASQTALLENLSEFIPALQSAKRWLFVGAVLTLLAALAAPSRRAVDVLLVAVFGFLAFKYARNIALFALIGAVPLTRAVDWAASRLPSRATAAAALAAAVALIALPATTGNWGVGLKPDTFPDKGVGLLAQYRPQGNILNFFHLGSYLRWRLDEAYPVFVDGRNFSRNRAVQMHDTYFLARPGWRFALTRLNINMVMTPATLVHSGKLIPLVPELARDPGWALVSVERAALTFVRADMLSGVPRLDNEIVWQKIIDEATQTLEDNPYAEGAPKAIEYAREMQNSGDDAGAAETAK
jgi:hypothetical protein